MLPVEILCTREPSLIKIDRCLVYNQCRILLYMARGSGSSRDNSTLDTQRGTWIAKVWEDMGQAWINQINVTCLFGFTLKSKLIITFLLRWLDCMSRCLFLYPRHFYNL